MDMNATVSSTESVTFAPWGVGNGTTTFTLPDKRSRQTLGAGQGSGLTNRILGAIGGAEEVAQTLATLYGHAHTFSVYPGNDGVDPRPAATSEASSPATPSTSTVGGSTPATVMNPFIVCNYIIKT